MGFKICLTSPPAILEGLLDPSLLTDTASSPKFLIIEMRSNGKILTLCHQQSLIIKFCPYPSHFFINIKSVSTSELLVINTNVIVNMAENKDKEGGKESSKPTRSILKQPTQQSTISDHNVNPNEAPDIVPHSAGKIIIGFGGTEIFNEDEDDVPTDIEDMVRMRNYTV